MDKIKKLKFVFPLWRGGNNKLYSLGINILDNIFLVDKSFDKKEIKIKKKNYSNSKINGIFHQEQIVDELKLAKKNNQASSAK